MNFMQVGIGFNTQPDHTKAAKEAVNCALAAIERRRADLAFLFGTEEFIRPFTLKTITEHLGGIPILGLTTPGLMLNRGISRNGILAVLFSLPEEMYFNTACARDILSKTALSAGEKLGEELLYGCKGIHRSLSIMFSEGYIPDGQDVALGLQERIGRSFPLVGASISGHNNRDIKNASLFYCGASLNNAACGVLFAGKMNFGLGVRCGWQALGKPREITASSGNTVYEINGRPAAELYREYFAKDTLSLDREINGLLRLYPLGIEVSGEDKYLVRTVSSIQSDDSIIFNGDMPQGNRVRLMIGSKDACLEDTREAAQTALKELKGQKAKLILIFNSLARAKLLSHHRNMEIEIIKGVFGGDAPIAGIYTSAEQAPLSGSEYLGKNYFNNNSICVLAIAS